MPCHRKTQRPGGQWHTQPVCPLGLSGMSQWLAVTLSPCQMGLFQAIKLKELSCCSRPTEPGAGGWGHQGGWAWPLVPCLLHPSL